MDTQKTAESCTQNMAHYQISCLSTSMPGSMKVPILGASNKQQTKWSIWGISKKFGNGLGWCHVMTPGLVDAGIFVSDVSGHGHTAPMPSRCPPRPAKWWSLRPWRGLRGWTFPRPDVAGLPAKGWKARPISCRRSTIWEKHHGKNNGKKKKWCGTEGSKE